MREPVRNGAGLSWIAGTVRLAALPFLAMAWAGARIVRGLAALADAIEGLPRDSAA